MSSKKQRSSKRKDSSFNEEKFVSVETKERYDNIMLFKAIIPERGFHNPGGRVEGQIEERNWHYFTATPSSACVGLIREFYANASERKGSTIFVRGKWIAFDSVSINRIYKLEHDEYDVFSGFRNSAIDYDEILRFLCGGGEVVQWKRKGNIVTNFPSSGLNSESKAWHYFISARLLPSGNTSEVTRERAVLNFAIQSGYSINIGKIIYQSLLHIFQANTSVALGHPSVIHDLCMAYDVEYLPSEEVLAPKTSISKSKISSYSSRNIPDPGESSAHPLTPPSRGRNLSLGDRMSRLEESFQGLRIDVNNLNRWHAQQDSREVRRERREERQERREIHRDEQTLIYRQYMSDYHTAQNLMYASASINVGPGRVQYPEPPLYSEFKEDDEEEEEGGDDDEEYEYDD